jgi:hypothetical protein
VEIGNASLTHRYSLEKGPKGRPSTSVFDLRRRERRVKVETAAQRNTKRSSLSSSSRRCTFGFAEIVFITVLFSIL